jgi:PPOX class probable F420-dependent enzyme
MPPETAILSARVRAFLSQPDRFGTIATLDPDGSPHQAVVWYRLEDDTLVVNSRAGRRWCANLQRDPRTAITFEDGYDYVTLRAHAEELHDPDTAQEDIAEMARRYHADDPAHAERLIERTFRPQHRISFRLHPSRVDEHLRDDR